VPILVFLDLSVLDLGAMYATDRRQTDRQTDRHQTSDVRQHHRERSVSGRFVAQRSSLFLRHPLSAPLLLRGLPLHAPLTLEDFL